jgi:hypothetical protein
VRPEFRFFEQSKPLKPVFRSFSIARDTPAADQPLQNNHSVPAESGMTDSLAEPARRNAHHSKIRRAARQAMFS